jgi:hypothetical protein
LEQTRAEKSYWTLKDFGNASMLELRGGLRTGRGLCVLNSATLLIRLRLATTLRMGASQVESPKCGLCVLNSVDRRVFIGVLGAVTDLIKSKIHQVLPGRPSHAASTDSGPRVPFHRRLERFTAKETHERLQNGTVQPWSLAGQPPTRPTRQWHLHMASSC